MVDTTSNPARLHNYTFADSGYTVKIQKVSPLLAMQLQNDFPPPTPPLQRIMVGDQETFEPNPSSPEYAQALQDYQRDFENRLRRMIIKRGVVIEFTEEMKADLAKVRADYLEITGKELAGNDDYVFLSYLAVGSDADLTDLITGIMQRSQPTDAVIAQTAKNFRR